MKKQLQLVALLTIALAATNAAAVKWEDAVPISVNAGIESPLVLFGFNPQPEPPAVVLETSTVFDPAAATLQLSGIEPTPFRGVPFQVYFAAEGGEFGAHPPDPGAPFDQLLVPFTTDGGQALNFLLTLTSPGTGIPGIGELAFNPQPEPPGNLGIPFGLQFIFDDLTGVETIALKLEVFDESGQALAVSAVPLPAAAWLFGSALLGLIGIARRRKPGQI